LKGLYTFGILIYVLLIHIASWFSPKAKLWVKGRKNWKAHLKKAIPDNASVIWFHCASLGEFEQARPVIEAYKKSFPDAFILLSFFSPSGYEIRKNYTIADYICYLPADFPSNAKDFVAIVKPQKAIFVKYEFWYNFLQALNVANCSTYLIAARFRPDQPFFQWYGSWFKKQLNNFYRIHLQDENSAEMLKKTGYTNFIVSADPRFDRVTQNAQQTEELPEIKLWLSGRSCMVAGSAWPADEKIFFPWHNHRALIIAPHEIDETHLISIEKQAGTSIIRYSELIKNPNQTSNVLLIDNIGMLMRIYSMAEFAFVGGGFGTGLHNILEPAAFGIPVVFGPMHEKFPEANALIYAGGGLSVSSRNDFLQFLERLEKDQNKIMAHNAQLFIQSNTGATELIMKDLIQN
jgi:3-deoxy-D-manno-octulosonic-acid transferase